MAFSPCFRFSHISLWSIPSLLMVKACICTLTRGWRGRWLILDFLHQTFLRRGASISGWDHESTLNSLVQALTLVDVPEVLKHSTFLKSNFVLRRSYLMTVGSPQSSRYTMKAHISPPSSKDSASHVYSTSWNGG